MASAVVLIGPSEALGILRRQFPADSAVQTFTDHEVREAVEFIATARPRVVAIDDLFAVTPRGEALVGRIMGDPGLAPCEIRILPRSAVAVPETPAASPDEASTDVGLTPAGAAPESPPLGRVELRLVPRMRMIDGVAITVDGSPAELVDLSIAGAQVLSRIVLRPNTRVRVILPEGTGALRCAGWVVWANFEMPQGQPPRYRAGLKLSGVDVAALQRFADRHRAPVTPVGSH